jgi:hypothetical protein
MFSAIMIVEHDPFLHEDATEMILSKKRSVSVWKTDRNDNKTLLPADFFQRRPSP